MIICRVESHKKKTNKNFTLDSYNLCKHALTLEIEMTIFVTTSANWMTQFLSGSNGQITLSGPHFVYLFIYLLVLDREMDMFVGTGQKRTECGVLMWE